MTGFDYDEGDELGLPWSGRHQRAFDALTRMLASGNRFLPRPLRHPLV